MKHCEDRFHLIDSPGMLHKLLADRVAADLSDAIATRGYASVAFSGGNTPRPFLQVLAKAPLDWSKVRIGLVDERWVDAHSGASNENLVRSELLGRGADCASFFGMYREEMKPEMACEAIAAEYEAQLLPFDVVVLGMGGDGHTASLFPHHEALSHLLNDPVVCGVAEAPVDPKQRISLSLHTLLAAKHLYLHFEGGEKLAVFEEACEGDDVQAMPVRAVLCQPQGKLEIYYT